MSLPVRDTLHRHNPLAINSGDLLEVSDEDFIVALVHPGVVSSHSHDVVPSRIKDGRHVNGLSPSQHHVRETSLRGEERLVSLAGFPLHLLSHLHGRRHP